LAIVNEGWRLKRSLALVENSDHLFYSRYAQVDLLTSCSAF
jgi:hypothetical protein